MNSRSEQPKSCQEKNLWPNESFAVTGSFRRLFAVTREWNWERAAEGYRRAINLAPSDATIRGLHAAYLAAQGRMEEAIAEARLAEGLDPLSLHQPTQAGFVLQLARRQDEAIRKFQSVLEVAIEPGGQRNSGDALQ